MRKFWLGCVVVSCFLAATAMSPAWAHGRVRVGVYFHEPFWPGVSWWYSPAPAYYDGYVPRDAAIDTDIHPERAEVWLDSHYVGIADQFDGFPRYLRVSPGRHRLEFRLEGYRTLVVDLNVRRGQLYELDRHLRYGREENDTWRNRDRHNDRYRNDDRERDRYRDRNRYRDRDDRYSEDDEDDD